MSDKLKQYCDRLQEEVKTAETRLARVGQHLVSPELTPLADWKARLQEATTECTAKREQAQQAAQRVKGWLEEMQNTPGAPLDESNLDREAVKAESQADREEGLALDALAVAAHAILQAEVAILRAFKTRKTAFDLERFRNTF
jgi:TATA-binding protein-associated factor Taf7